MSLLNDASLIVTPNAYKEGKLYSVIPSDGSGDLSVTRATTATRVNSAGLVELTPYNLLTYSEQFDNAAWAKDNVTITANTATAPSGLQNADLITGSVGNAQKYIRQTISQINSGTTATLSCYFKKETLNYIQLTLGGDANFTANFDLNNGVVGAVGVGTTASIQSVGDGWYRCTASKTLSANSTNVTIFIIDSLNATRGQATSSTDSAYLWGAQLVEGTDALPYKRTETRLNIPRLDYSLGSCPSILVEPQRTNLALYSEQFDNAAWAKTNATITANATTSPSGTLTADEYVGNGVSGVHTILSNATISSSTTYSLSVFCKKGTNDFIQIGGGGTLFGTEVWCNFNLNTGAIGSKGVLTTAEIKSIGNGWYRCTVIGAAVSSGTSTGMFLQLINSETSLRGESNTLATSVYLWGAQLEIGSTATTYQPIATTQQAFIASQFKFNLVNPVDSDAAFRLVFNGGWTHSSNGATPNGTNGFADTKLVPSSVLTQDSTHISSYIRNSSQGVLLGTDINKRLWIAPNFNGTQKYVEINSGTVTAPSITISNNTGLWIGSRITNAQSKLYNNSSLNYAATSPSSGLDTASIFVSARNVSGASNYSSSQTAFASIGDGLTDTEAANLYTRVQAYQTALSRQV